MSKHRSETPSQARKKRKVEDTESSDHSTDQPLEPLNRHERFWFNGGTILVNSADGIAFKLYAGLLALHSGVFDEMISATILDLPELGQDLAVLFDIIHGKSTWLDRKIPVKFSALRTVTSMALKYRIQNIVDSAVSRLRDRFPSTCYDDWEDTSNEEPIVLEDNDFIAVVVLARECNTPDVLPLALYDCCLLQDGEIFEGVQYGTEKVKLSSDDLRRYFTGLKKLQDKTGDVMQVLLELCAGHRRVEKCTTVKQCKSALSEIILRSNDMGYFRDSDCLRRLDSELDEWAEEDDTFDICKPCKLHISQEQRVRQVEIFKQLGAMFGIEDWPRPRR